MLKRKQILQQLVGDVATGVVRFSEHIAGSGEKVRQQACAGGLEGTICKQAGGRYVPGRGKGWVKAKCARRQEFVIGGYTKPAGSRQGLGALLLGHYEKDKLVYAGRVGTGFTRQSLRDIHAALAKLERKTPAFTTPPSGAAARGVIWVAPELVAEVEFTEWTDDGLLRHPSFQGLREDKSPKSIIREKAMAVPNEHGTREKIKGERRQLPAIAKSKSSKNITGKGAEVAGIAITHPDRVVFPDVGLTKLDVAQHYESMADWILPELIGRPLTIVRCPAGQGSQCFYQKHLTDSTPDSVHGVAIKENDGIDEYFVIDDLPGLISLVQLGALEFHPWPAREDKVERA